MWQGCNKMYLGCRRRRRRRKNSCPRTDGWADGHRTSKVAQKVPADVKTGLLRQNLGNLGLWLTRPGNDWTLGLIRSRTRRRLLFWPLLKIGLPPLSPPLLYKRQLCYHLQQCLLLDSHKEEHLEWCSAFFLGYIDMQFTVLIREESEVVIGGGALYPPQVQAQDSLILKVRLIKSMFLELSKSNQLVLLNCCLSSC